LTRKFESFKFYSPSLHTAAGQTGSGKTALLFSVADAIHKQTKKEIYVMLKETDRPVEEYKLPEHIHSYLGDIDEIPQDCVIICDDAQRIVPARRAMANINVALDELIGTLRHDRIDFCLDVQTYATLDRNTCLRVDYRWYKKPYQEEINFGRAELKDEAAQVDKALTGKPIDTAYLVSRNREGYEGLVTDIPLPKYWSSELSTMHRRLTKEEINDRKPIWERWRIF
jgi:hypothetical protein